MYWKYATTENHPFNGIDDTLMFSSFWKRFLPNMFALRVSNVDGNAVWEFEHYSPSGKTGHTKFGTVPVCVLFLVRKIKET